MCVEANKKFEPIVAELFMKCRKLNITLAFISEACFAVPKDIRLNATHCLIMKISNKELQQIA